uniref:Receptor-like serine/threonine-protein kinase n=1 Tax=Oryza brachyantha TaxID=4533 RepID=J3LVJ9_ORYBR
MLPHFILFGLLFFSLHSNCPQCSAKNCSTLMSGQELTGANKLISSNGRFALGFFQSGTSKSADNTTLLNWYLGIWFNKISKFTAVWVANRDYPITDPIFKLSKLVVSGDGNLVILNNVTKSMIWSSQIESRRNASRKTLVVLSDNGNLVILDASNQSNVLWQSFDYPTDVMLPGSKLGRNKVTGQKYSLISKKNSDDPAAGLYCMELDPSDDRQCNAKLCNSSMVYFSTGEWNGRYFNAMPEMSSHVFQDSKFVDNDEEEYFTYTTIDHTVITICLLDVSGLLKQLIWVEEIQDWELVFFRPKDSCDVFSVCGPFTVCTDNALPLCSCMKGFSVKSPRDWELDDRHEGCTRNTPLDCSSSSNKSTAGLTDKFFPITSVRLPYDAHRMEAVASADECMQVCLRNCSCTAYSYGESGCSVWNGQLINLKQYNGTTNTNEDVLHLRLAAVELQSWGHGRRTMMGVAAAASVSAFSFLVFILLLMILRRKRRSCGHPVNRSEQGAGIVAFTYAHLQRATKNFSEKLGAGSFGSVFKGILSDSTTIAVKMLDGARQGEKQFRAEVSTIGMIQHVNLVKLIGFCCEGDKRLLVYEHMVNMSLDAHLFKSSSTILNWRTRYQIAIGIAKGLSYLHESCHDCIIHCDIKPENILLDASFVPKVADFGMAKLLGRDFSRVLTTMRGTIGYLAPEWISGVAITQKVDVYSYGMVLLEIISGRRNTLEEYDSSGNQAVYFPVQAAHKLLEGDVESLVDPQLQGDINIEEVVRACKVACWCIQDDDFNRPTMGGIVQVLEGLVELDMPQVPRLLEIILSSPEAGDA